MTSLQYQQFLSGRAKEDEKILDLLILADGNPGEVASWLVEEDVATGLYEGCSTDLEIAYSDHVANAERVLREAGG